MPVETVGHEPVEYWPRLDESWRQEFVQFFGIDAQVTDARGHGAAFDSRHSVEEAGGVASDGVHDLPDIVERNASWSAAVVYACRKLVLQNILYRAAKVRARKRVAVFVRKKRRGPSGAETVRNPVDSAGASAGRVVHRERHAENHGIWLDVDDGVFGFGLVLAVIVDGVFRVGFDVRAVRLCLFVAAKDHVGGNSDKCRVVAGGERGGVNALVVVQKPAACRVAFARLQRAVPACVNDGAEVETFEKFAQAFRFFGIYAENVVSENARVLDRADPDNIVPYSLLKCLKSA